MKKLKIVVIDNYDSFTYNLVHILDELDVEVTIIRNDQFHIEDLENFDKIMISPGPVSYTHLTLPTIYSV